MDDIIKELATVEKITSKKYKCFIKSKQISLKYIQKHFRYYDG